MSNQCTAATSAAEPGKQKSVFALPAIFPVPNSTMRNLFTTQTEREYLPQYISCLVQTIVSIKLVPGPELFYIIRYLKITRNYTGSNLISARLPGVDY